MALGNAYKPYGTRTKKEEPKTNNRLCHVFVLGSYRRRWRDIEPPRSARGKPPGGFSPIGLSCGLQRIQAAPHPPQPSGSVPVDLDLGDLHEVSAQIGLIVACQLTGDDADEAGLPVSIRLDDTSYFSMVAFTDQRISPNT